MSATTQLSHCELRTLTLPALRRELGRLVIEFSRLSGARRFGMCDGRDRRRAWIGRSDRGRRRGGRGGTCRSATVRANADAARPGSWSSALTPAALPPARATADAATAITFAPATSRRRRNGRAARQPCGPRTPADRAARRARAPDLLCGAVRRLSAPPSARVRSYSPAPGASSTEAPVTRGLSVNLVHNSVPMSAQLSANECTNQGQIRRTTTIRPAWCCASPFFGLRLPPSSSPDHIRRVGTKRRLVRK